ncbi:TPA: hypothetical protein PXI76_003416 [Yersinia enterocolitica]|nr:hypothetical protein [Yersinia enterocolitica]HDL7604574.1 hypothetical protein [Yersinia enterocolitica]
MNPSEMQFKAMQKSMALINNISSASYKPFIKAGFTVPADQSLHTLSVRNKVTAGPVQS